MKMDMNGVWCIGVGMVLMWSGHVLAGTDVVTVHNAGAVPVFVRLYQKPIFGDGRAEQISHIIELKPGAFGQLERPKLGFRAKLTVDRKLIFAHNAQMLKNIFSHEELKAIPWVSAGSAEGSTFYVAHNADHTLKGYSAAHWSLEGVGRTGR